ncbi:uncharacterized protein SCHCODRAFT_02493979 [Schizophyllum commune H4-8]|uniref:Uncharacterized protein n=1 Tax=Schizophyllum commune (strain H4-8 / FGSC 9210) TaxID=578458 RepID=D8PY73_SCHCM|nr:uncharacterized protein SCHCODRAFT_02493979 [Schizophyllum commune H4-8]KAI5897211.1 hypothetical protein SCHCODRAFT_02493979 [Schizophyllum commune H4-8]
MTRVGENFPISDNSREAHQQLLAIPVLPPLNWPAAFRRSEAVARSPLCSLVSCPKPSGRPRGEARYFAQLFGRRSPKHPKLTSDKTERGWCSTWRQAHHLPHTKILTVPGHSLLAVEMNRRCYPTAYAVESTATTVSSLSVGVFLVFGDSRGLSLLDRIDGAGEAYMSTSRASCLLQLALDVHAMAPTDTLAHRSARKSHQAYGSKLDSINWEFHSAAGLNNRAPTTENIVWALGRKNSRRIFVQKKLHALAAILVAGESEADDPDFAPDPLVAACMYFLYDCIRATDPDAKYYGAASVPRPDFLLNPVALTFQHADEKLRGEAKIAAARRSNQDMFEKLRNAPRLPADHVAVVAERLGYGELTMGECGPASEAERGFAGRRSQARRRGAETPPPSTSRRKGISARAARAQRRRKSPTPTASIDKADVESEDEQDDAPVPSHADAESESEEDSVFGTPLPPRKRARMRISSPPDSPGSPPVSATLPEVGPASPSSATSVAPQWSPLNKPELLLEALQALPASTSRLFSLSPEASGNEVSGPASEASEHADSGPSDALPVRLRRLPLDVLDVPEQSLPAPSPASSSMLFGRPTPAQVWHSRNTRPPTPPWDKGLY